MRRFDDADRKKKRARIILPDNPGGLPADALSRLEGAVKEARKDDYVSCPTGWRIARDAGVSRLDVGAAIDRLGIRVTDCQLGCFKVDKTPYAGTTADPLGAEVAARVAVLHEKGGLTCAAVFDLARELGVAPRALAEAANGRGYKLSRCQLGCF